jgi:hypothetical protein
MQMKIILSFLILLSLAFLVPSDAYANDGSIILETTSLEHDARQGQYNSLVQVDSDTYALAYEGKDKDGFISTFTISSDGSSIVEVDTLEHDDDHGQYNSLVHVVSDTYALAYAGTNDDGFISTFTIDSEGVITPIQIQNHANTDTVDDVANLEHDEERGMHNSLVKINSDTYALAYEGLDRDGFISTFTIYSNNGTIKPIHIQNHAKEGGSANLEHDEDRASFNSLVHVVSDTYALAYTSHGEDGFISTFTIDSDTAAITAVKTQSEGNNLEYDEVRGIHNSLVQVDSDTYALAYTGIDANGFISTFTISSDGTSIDKVENLEHDTDVGNYPSLVQVDSDTYALAYTSGGKDGFISTFTISSEEIKEKNNSECYDCEAPKLAKVEVHITSNPSDEIINENAPQISETRDYVWTFDQKTPYPMFDDYKTPIVADPGDEVEIILELTDNRTLERVYDSGTYTNFLTKPNDMNTFYANNFDEYGKVSTTYYEWHQTGEDLVYDYDNTVQ